LTAAAKSPAWHQFCLKTFSCTYLKEGVTLLSCCVRLDGINVGLLVCFQFSLLSFPQFGKDIGGSVLGQRFVEELDGLLEIAQFLVGGSYSTECPVCQLRLVVEWAWKHTWQ
jgi:hypothetical protein